MKKLSIATVGLGRVGLSKHVIVPYEHKNFEVVACMDKVQERLDEVKDLYHVNVYDDYKKMIDHEKIDVVVIASPTNFHYEQTKYALLKGIDVFLEKPMTITLEETQELVALAKKLNRKIMLNQPHRSFPHTIALQDILKQKLIGDLYRVNYNISVFRVRTDWQSLKKYGGGMIYNYGAHLVDLMLHVFNPDIKRVCCMTNKVLTVGDTEDVVKIMLQDSNQITYDLDINTTSNLTHPKWFVYGNRGSIVIDDHNVTVKYLKDVSVLDQKLQTTLAAKNRLYDTTENIEWIEKVIPISNYEAISYYDKVYDFFALNKAPFVPIEDSLKVMEILNECEHQ